MSHPTPEIRAEPKQQAYAQSQYATTPQPAMSQPIHHPTPPQYEKDRIVAGILGLILGTFGIHKFYLGKIGNGVMYLLFCWTGIPSFVGFIEGIMYLAESDEDFQERVRYL